MLHPPPTIINGCVCVLAAQPLNKPEDISMTDIHVEHLPAAVGLLTSVCCFGIMRIVER